MSGWQPILAQPDAGGGGYYGGLGIGLSILFLLFLASALPAFSFFAGFWMTHASKGTYSDHGSGRQIVLASENFGFWESVKFSAMRSVIFLTSLMGSFVLLQSMDWRHKVALSFIPFNIALVWGLACRLPFDPRLVRLWAILTALDAGLVLLAADRIWWFLYNEGLV